MTRHHDPRVASEPLGDLAHVYQRPHHKSHAQRAAEESRKYDLTVDWPDGSHHGHACTDITELRRNLAMLPEIMLANDHDPFAGPVIIEIHMR